MGLFFRRDGGEPAIEKGRFRHGQRQQTLCGGNQLVPRTYEKTREMIQENLKLVDAAVEVTDARIPISSRNPVIDEIIRKKPRVVILNKSDLADEKAVGVMEK